MFVVSIVNVVYYVWGQQCDGWYLLVGGDFSVIEECMLFGIVEVCYWYVCLWQFFYVLGGIVVLELEGVVYCFEVGQGLYVLFGVVYQMCNDFGEDVCFLVIFLLCSYGDCEVVDG